MTNVNPFDTEEIRSGAANPGTSKLRGKLHGQRIDAAIRRTAREIEQQRHEQFVAAKAEAKAERAALTPVDPAELKDATWVLDSRRGEWREVVRVNKTTVSVATGYSWTDRIPHSRIVAVRKNSNPSERERTQR